MLALKNTTMNWFKGGRQNTSKKRDNTPTGSTATEETSNALVRIENAEFPEMERDTETPRTHSYTPTSPTHSRVTSPTLRDASPLAIESHSPTQPGRKYEDTGELILATTQDDDTDTIHMNGGVEDRVTELLSSAQGGKKKGVKLRVAALNMLKMKPSTFLRKPQDGDELPVSRRRVSVDQYPNNSDRMALTRSNTAAGTSTAQPRRTGRLTKPPPPELVRQRRSIVVESIQEDTLDPLEPRPPNWGTGANRPDSSQSSHHGGPNRGDDVTSLAADTNPVTGGNVPGGLCPRPPSLKRHWSDGPHSKRDSLTQMGGPAGSPPRTEGSDRVRPLSFNMLNAYGSMKITEAVTLESRVRDLETQVATLQTYVTPNVSTSTEVERRPSSKSSNLSHKSSRLTDKSSRLTDKSAQTSPALGPPFSEEDMALSKRPDTAQSTHTTSTYMHGHESDYSVAPESSTNGAPSRAGWRSRGPITPNHTPYGDSSASSYVSDETINVRNRSYGPLDNPPGPSTDASKRSTVISLETITPSRNQNRDYEMEYHRERERAMQAPAVTMTEFNGVLKLLRREYRARKKLEVQVQTLQEQMNHVLHRQLLQSDPIYNFGRSPTITGRSQATASAASTQRPEHINGRRTSSEVPTPDLTPPRGRHDLSRASSHLFNGFDSSASATDIDDDRSYYVGGEDDDSEHWQTPAEDTRTLLQLNGHLVPPMPLSAQKRTMSISQITEKASLASARTAAGR